MNLRRNTLSLLSALLLLVACASQTFDLEREATKVNLTARSVTVDGFTLQAWQSPAGNATADATLFIYIEGDGRPWTNGGRTPATDPTPVHALAFDLMSNSPGASLYLTRPCYFGNHDQRCDPTWWTAARYSTDVVNAMSAAIRQLVEDGRPIVLVGYSGGGALAMLLASSTPDVAAVITVAGLLDTEAWTDFHNFDPLEYSLNPAKVVLPESIMQIHLAGGKDRNIPPDQARHVLTGSRASSLWVYEDFDHVCCWVNEWQRIYARILAEIARRQ